MSGGGFVLVLMALAWMPFLAGEPSDRPYDWVLDGV